MRSLTLVGVRSLPDASGLPPGAVGSPRPEGAVVDFLVLGEGVVLGGGRVGAWPGGDAVPTVLTDCWCVTDLKVRHWRDLVVGGHASLLGADPGASEGVRRSMSRAADLAAQITERQELAQGGYREAHLDTVRELVARATLVQPRRPDGSG